MAVSVVLLSKLSVGYTNDSVEKLREQNQYANEKVLVFLFVSRLPFHTTVDRELPKKSTIVPGQNSFSTESEPLPTKPLEAAKRRFVPFSDICMD